MVKFIAKLFVSALLLAVLAQTIEPGAIAAVVRAVRPEFLVAALVLVWLSSAIASGRWVRVMRGLDFGGRASLFVSAYFKAMFFNQALPSSIGGDAYRVLVASRLGRGAKAAFYGVLTDRGLGLAGLLLLNLAALLLRRDLLPPALTWALVAVSVAGLAGVFVFAWAGTSARVGQTLVRLRWLAPLGEIAAGFRTVCATPMAVLQHALLAVTIHLLAVGAMACIGTGVGLRYDFTTYLVLVPPVVILSLLPVSLAGWGVREGGMVGLFMLVGADEARVLSMSVLYGIVWVVASLPGLVLFLVQRNRQPAA